MILSYRKYGLWVCMLVSLLYSAEAQGGFVSIDCGATNGDKKDLYTGILWTTDEHYISSGINRVLSSGNSTVNEAQVLEYMVAAKSNSINFCLLPSVGNAFINALELRPLADGMYDVVFHGRYLKLLTRLNCGATLGAPPVRYPNDVYDRVWETPGPGFNITTDNTSSVFQNTARVFDKPPNTVLQTAWVANTSFGWFCPISDYELAKTTIFYINHFMVEINFSTPSTGPRVMDMRLNERKYFYNISIDHSAIQIYSKNATLYSDVDNSTFSISNYSPDGANFTFTAANGSTLGPILSGGEIYASRETNVSSTMEEDGELKHPGLTPNTSVFHMPMSL